MTTAVSAHTHWTRVFIPIWIGQALSLLGSQITQFALVWWLTERTGSATVLATGTLMATLPGVIVGPLIGTLIDRWNRKLVMICADAVGALTALALMGLFWSETIAIWQVYLILVVRAIASSFHLTAKQASNALLVPQGQLARLAGINHVLNGTINILAPPLAATLYGLLTPAVMMLFDVGTAALAMLILLVVQIPQPVRNARPASLLSDLRSGVSYVLAWPGLCGLVIVAALLNFLLVPVFSLMPLLITRHFAGGAWELSTLNALFALGFVLGGITLGLWGGFRRRILTVLIAIMLMGCALAVPGLISRKMFAVALGAMLCAGVFNAICNGSIAALMQSLVKVEMQGRVFTLVASACGAMAPVGLLIAGPFADRFGVQLWFVLAGGLCVVIALVACCVPVVMRMEQREHTVVTTTV